MITSDDILGKEAVDSSGAILGTVVKLHIDTDKKDIAGITIDMGFAKPDLFVGLDYIKHFGIDAILLNKVPVERYKGLEVLTHAGKRVGKVINVHVAKIHPKAFEISLGIGKKKVIPIADIEQIGVSLILKKGVKI